MRKQTNKQKLKKLCVDNVRLAQRNAILRKLIKTLKYQVRVYKSRNGLLNNLLGTNLEFELVCADGTRMGTEVFIKKLLVLPQGFGNSEIQLASTGKKPWMTFSKE